MEAAKTGHDLRLPIINLVRKVEICISWTENCIKCFLYLVPREIKAQGPEAKLAYRNALKTGKVKVYRARIMLIGQDRAGKTSLKNRS